VLDAEPEGALVTGAFCEPAALPLGFVEPFGAALAGVGSGGSSHAARLPKNALEAQRHSTIETVRFVMADGLTTARGELRSGYMQPVHVPVAAL
jgi:hypothetical protein